MKYNVILIVILLLAFFVIGYTVSQNSQPQGLYDLNGKLVSFDDYKGKYSVLAFTFISCPSICPRTNVEFNRLREKYGNDINLIAINVDPLNDTPEKIKNYMTENNYDWSVLVGDKDMSEVKKVIGGILGYPDPDHYVESPSHHPPGFHLMDKNFEFIGNSDGNSVFPIGKEVDSFMEQLDQLLGEIQTK